MKKFESSFLYFQGALVALFWPIFFFLVLAAVANAQPASQPGGQGQKNRPVLKKQDPSKKLPRPADPDTAAYFVLTARFDEQVEAIASDYIFQDLRKTFGDNIVVVQSLEQIPKNVDKSRIHTVNLRLTQNRLDDVSADSVPKAVARAVLDPIGNTAASKVEQATKIPGTGEAARIILRQGKRSTNLDGQDTTLRYWWTMNVQVDGLSPRAETFIWKVARHRTDDYQNRYCFNAVGLGSNFTNIEPYDTEDWLGCDYQAITPGLYNLTVKELWQRPAVKQWLATISKPPVARSVSQIVAANENCAEQEWDPALRAYRCALPKVETPCQRRRPNPDGSFMCLDASVGDTAGIARPRPRQTPAPANTACGGDPLCGLGGGTPVGGQQPPPEIKPTPTPVPPPAPKPTPDPASNPPLKADPNAQMPNLGHTGRASSGFQEIFFDEKSGMAQMSGPNVERVLAFLVNNENLAWNPAWRGISWGRNATAAWREAEGAMKQAGVKGVIVDGRVSLAEWNWLNTQDPTLFKLTSEMLQSKAKAAAAAPVKK